MAATAFFHDEQCFWHTGGEHALIFPVGGFIQPPNGASYAESPDSKRRLKSLIDVSGLGARLHQSSAEMADEADLLRVHTQNHIRRFRDLSTAGGGAVGFEASFAPGGYDIARRSAGLGIAALNYALTNPARRAYALTRPPGHHCLPDQGLGFCLLANGAIAIETMIARHGLSKVAVVDIDVHHGNGTEAIFYERADVLTISLHQERCFPTDSGEARDRGRGRGAGYNLNIPLLAGGGHQSYADAFELLVLPALRRYRPEVILVAAGYDASSFDPLARMMATSETFRMMMQSLVDAADDLSGGRIAAMHEGGYAEAYVPFCGLALMEALAGERTAVVDPALASLVSQQPGPAFRKLQRELLAEQAQAAGLA